MTDASRERRRAGADRRLTGEPVRVLVVDSQALFRAGIVEVMSREEDLVVVGEALDAATAIAAIDASEPGVVLLDLSIGAPGTEAMQRIKREHPMVAIIAISDLDDGDLLFEATKAGAAAYVTRSIQPDDLLEIIRRVHGGEYLVNDSVLSRPDVASRVLREFRGLAAFGAGGEPVFAPLSPRELEILASIAKGMTNKQAAYALSISEQTVKNHMSSILRKLSVNDRTQAVVYAMKQGWIALSDA